MNLHTFFLLFKQSWLDAFIDRGETYIQLIAWFIHFVVYLYLWIAIFGESTEIGPYTLASILTYFFIIQIFRNLVFSHIGFIISGDIRHGDMVNMLTKPTSIFPHYYALELGRNSVRFLLSIISNTLIFFIFFSFFDLSSVHTSNVLIGILALIPAHFINFCMTAIIGALAFWITDSSRLIFFYFAFATLASGWIIPIDLFPETLRSILMATPFQYTFYFPIKLIQGMLT